MEKICVFLGLSVRTFHFELILLVYLYQGHDIQWLLGACNCPIIRSWTPSFFISCFDVVFQCEWYLIHFHLYVISPNTREAPNPPFSTPTSPKATVYELKLQLVPMRKIPIAMCSCTRTLYQIPKFPIYFYWTSKGIRTWCRYKWKCKHGDEESWGGFLWVGSFFYQLVCNCKCW